MLKLYLKIEQQNTAVFNDGKNLAHKQLKEKEKKMQLVPSCLLS